MARVNQGTQNVFSGIDPGPLKTTIDSIQRDQENLSNRASYYKTQLAYYGLGGRNSPTSCT